MQTLTYNGEHSYVTNGNHNWEPVLWLDVNVQMSFEAPAYQSNEWRLRKLWLLALSVNKIKESIYALILLTNNNGKKQNGIKSEI